MGSAPGFDIARWLGRLGLGEYAEAFARNNVDADILASLTSDDLREIGVASVGHRRRLLEAARQMSTDPVVAKSGDPAPAPALPTAERRNITVMFCDLVGSTALSVLTDPEEFGEFIDRFRRALEETIVAHGGYVAQFLGDGVLAYFGYPRSLGQDAESAVAAGIAVTRAVAFIEPVAGQKPSVRVGIATGLTVVGTADPLNEARGENAVGEIPNLAARLQALAGADTVVVSDATRSLIGELFECTDLGEVALKGFRHPVRAWRVDGRRSGATRFEALRSARGAVPFIGREVELDRVRQRLAAARAGQGQVVLITGEAGLGKSRLARQLLKESFGDAAAVPVLQCTPYDRSLPFHAVRHFVERASGLVPNEAPEIAAGKLASLISGLELGGPESVALLLELVHVPGADLSALAGITSHERRNRTIRLLREFLLQSAGISSAIVVEDVQWIDPSTAELIEMLMPAIRTMPVLLVATMRPGRFPSWLLATEFRVVQLDRLPADELRDLIRAAARGAPLPDAVVETIVGRSDGIPIFAEELTRAYIEAAGGEGEPDEDDLSRIPVTLNDTIISRLDRVPLGRRLAPIAAAVAQEFPVEILSEIADLPEEDVRAGIAELLDADLMVAGYSTFGQAIAFRHQLVREAAYQLLLRRDRVALHARIAETLRTRFPQIAEHMPHIVAIQFAKAGNHREAAVEWDRAAAHAAQRSAYSEAIDHISRAIEANGRCSEGRQRDERELTYRLNLASALIAARGFMTDGVAAQMERAVDLSGRLRSANALLPALISKCIVLGAAGNVRASLELSFQARETAASGGDVDRLLAHRMLGTTLLFNGQFRRATEELESFFALYEPALHEPGLARVGPSNHAIMSAVGLAQINTIWMEHEEAARWRRRALETARASGRVHDICSATVFAGCLLPAFSRDMDALAAEAAVLKELAESHDLPYWRSHADLFSGLPLIRAGHDDEGFLMARRGIRGLVASSAFMNGWFILYGEACQEAGRTAEASEVLARAAAAIDSGETWLAAEYYRVGALIAGARGESTEAVRALLDKALQTAEAQGARLFAERARMQLASLAPLRGA